MATPNKFWNKIAKKYAQRPIGNPEAYRVKLAKTAEYLHENMEVLEFGCGTGGTAVVHAPKVKHYRGIDISSAMLVFAQEKAQEAGVTNLSFEENTIETMQLEDNSLDMVLGLSILHLLENKEAVISKVYCALKPGGYFVTSTMCLQESYAWLKWVAPLGQFLGLMPLLRIFSADDLKKALSDAGFTSVHDWLPAKNAALFLIVQKPQ